MNDNIVDSFFGSFIYVSRVLLLLKYDSEPEKNLMT